MKYKLRKIKVVLEEAIIDINEEEDFDEQVNEAARGNAEFNLLDSQDIVYCSEDYADTKNYITKTKEIIEFGEHHYD
ncbi:hypothetical protein [Burkholderia cepacia]|uniref:hypothetical protein n=1 Tax=Burkholderia cepacia TaxID=292 RepID=UPI00158D69C3|nr:hypothetical protein [Burkholderia cepacia]